MSEIVDSSQIERIVGRARHWRAHFARAASDEQTVYILHSKLCLADNSDLRQCPFSIALSNWGIAGQPEWDGLEDQPVHVTVTSGRLVPARIGLVG